MLRRAIFRDVACPSSSDCGRLKALIQQVLTLFEENQNEVKDSSFLRDCVICQNSNSPSIQILTLVGGKPVIAESLSIVSPFGDRVISVHLHPIPSDIGCSEHYGNVQKSFHHNMYSDLRNVATCINRKVPVEQQLPVPEVAPPPQQRLPGQQENFEVPWKELAVTLAPSPDVFFNVSSSENFGFRFKPAVPCSEFKARSERISALKKQGDAADPPQFQRMNKNQKKRAKERTKRINAEIAASVAEESNAEGFLKPSDIARVRFFLCFNSDVQVGKLPDVHLEIDPRLPIAESIAEFEKRNGGLK